MEIFDKHLIDTIKDCISANTASNLSSESEKSRFVKRLTISMIKLKLSKEKIINLHAQAKAFLKKVYEEMYNR